MKIFRISKAKSLPKEKQEILQQHLYNAEEGFKFLQSIISDRINEIDHEMCSKRIYDCPSYTYKLSDLAGAKRELKYILSLLTEDD